MLLTNPLELASLGGKNPEKHGRYKFEIHELLSIGLVGAFQVLIFLTQEKKEAIDT